MKQRAVVMGAGASGLAAARLAARRGAEVTVIEPAPGPGGAWMPYEAVVDGRRVDFDRGIRMGMATGDERLDHAIYGCLDIEWNRIDGFPNEGHVLGGRLNRENQCPDVRLLGDEVADAVVRELLAAEEEPAADHVDAWLRGRFGATVVERVFEPFLRKVFGCSLDALAPKAERFFVPGRVIVADEPTTRGLRDAHPELRGRMAHPSSRSLDVPGRGFLHPARGAMGRWIEESCRDLEASGGEIRFGASVASVERHGDRVTAVELDDGTALPCDVLFWSRPPALLCRAAGISVPSARPAFRDLAVVHLVASEEPSTDLHYATFYDPGDAIHRVFFTRQVRPDCAPLERRAMSVEVVLGPDEALDEAASTERVWGELRSAGLVPETARPTWSHVERFSRVFPILTPEVAAGDRACRAALAGLTNAALVGRSEDAAFLNMILLACDRAVNELLEDASARTAA